jgi:hypothetical protein
MRAQARRIVGTRFAAGEFEGGRRPGRRGEIAVGDTLGVPRTRLTPSLNK